MAATIHEVTPTTLGAVIDDIHRINEAAVPAVGAATPDHLRFLVSESIVSLVALVDDDVAGFCVVLAPGSSYDSVNYQWFGARFDDFVYLDRVAIDPEHQGLGIGRLLYAAVEQTVAIRRPSATTFGLEVNLRPRNDQSLGFHDRLGFGEVGQQETNYGTLVSLRAKRLDAAATPAEEAPDRPH